MALNPYEWPFPKRSDLMSLSQIGFKDYSCMQSHSQAQKQSTSLKTDDIDGAKPQYLQYKSKEPAPGRICAAEVLRAEDKQRPHYSVDSRYRKGLNTDDIDGSKPRAVRFRTQRCTDPLAPEYRVPSFNQVTPRSASIYGTSESGSKQKSDAAPKSVRDPLRVDDIEGARSLAHPWLRYNRKNGVPNDDIEGSHPRQTRFVKEVSASLHVKDINDYRIFRTKRTQNPLEPVYIVRTNDNNIEEYGHIKGSKPIPFIPKIVPPERLQRFNNNKDIEGSQAGYLLDRYKQLTNRGGYNSLKTRDIDGCASDTKKYGISTSRVTDPNQPLYEVPGGKEANNGDVSASRDFGVSSRYTGLGFSQRNTQDFKLSYGNSFYAQVRNSVNGSKFERKEAPKSTQRVRSVTENVALGGSITHRDFTSSQKTAEQKFDKFISNNNK